MPQFTDLPIVLRRVVPADLDVFFEHQRDPEACQMAAFTRPDPENREGFDRYWQRNLNNPENDHWTIELASDHQVVGHVLSYVMEGDREMSYWIDRAHWGKGIATLALQEYLKKQPLRPLFARAAADNHGSIRVLEKCGFQEIGEDQGFAEARGQEITEKIFRLDT